MSRRPSTLIDSAAFRRRMRGVQARAVRLEVEAEAQEREWRLIIERRRREKAAFEALELGSCQAALDLGQDALDRFPGVGQFGSVHRRQSLGSDLIEKLQRILGVCCGLSGESFKHALKRLSFARVIHHQARKLVQTLTLRSDQAPMGIKRLFDRQNGVGRHRLLSPGWRLREKAESPSETSAPAATTQRRRP